jgi:hypothetical protein
MSSGQTFVEACLAGEALLDDVDDWVDVWHDAAGAPRGCREDLEAYLGFSDIEYSLWAEKPSMLRTIIAARKRHLPLEEVHSESSYALIAARAADDGEAVKLLEWLKKTGRLDSNDISKGC